MISLSQEWSLLSRAMYGQKFIDELDSFLKSQKINSVLECGCGDGDVLYGLALKGFYGIGVDIDKEMIELANRNNSHKNLRYLLMDWQNLNKVKGEFDAVMCRGNSLSAVAGWGNNLRIDPNKAKVSIRKSLEGFFGKLRDNGLLYVDTTSQKEIDLGGGKREMIFPNIHLNGEITHNWKTRIRTITGGGVLLGEKFQGTTYSYLMTPEELEEIVKEFNPKTIWRPRLTTEINYDIICARK